MNYGALITWLNTLKSCGLVKSSSIVDYEYLGSGDYSCALRDKKTGKSYLFIYRNELAMKVPLEDVEVPNVDNLDTIISDLLKACARG